MKKWTIFLILFFSCDLIKAQYAFSLTEKDANGNSFGLSKYGGKKLLIILCSRSNPDTGALRKLDSMYQNMSGRVSFLLIPISDFDGKERKDAFSKSYLDSMNLKMDLVKIDNVRKGNSRQSALFRYLTKKEENIVFDIDVEVPWQMFALTEGGRLYAVMLGKDDVESGRLTEILNKQTN